MEMAKAAQQLAARVANSDEPMIFLNIGEPDFSAPDAVQQAAIAAMREGKTNYTPALGLPALREAISGWYATRFGLDIDPARIAVTAGASGALQLACLALIESGDEILMPDPSYPCNRNFVTAAEGVARLIPTTADSRFQLTPEQVKEMIADGTISGGMIPKTETALKAIEDGVRAVVILDGRLPNAALLELFTEHGAGSIIRSTEPRVKPKHK